MLTSPIAAESNEPKAAAVFPPPQFDMSDLIYDKSDGAKVATSSSLLKAIERKGFVQCLHRLNAGLGSGYLADLSRHGLFMILRLMIRIKFSVRMAHLGHLDCLAGVLSGGRALLYLCHAMEVNRIKLQRLK